MGVFYTLSKKGVLIEWKIDLEEMVGLAMEIKIEAARSRQEVFEAKDEVAMIRPRGSEVKVDEIAKEYGDSKQKAKFATTKNTFFYETKGKKVKFSQKIFQKIKKSAEKLKHKKAKIIRYRPPPRKHVPPAYRTQLWRLPPTHSPRFLPAPGLLRLASPAHFGQPQPCRFMGSHRLSSSRSTPGLGVAQRDSRAAAAGARYWSRVRGLRARREAFRNGRWWRSSKAVELGQRLLLRHLPRAHGAGERVGVGAGWHGASERGEGWGGVGVRPGAV